LFHYNCYTKTLSSCDEDHTGVVTKFTPA